VGLPATEQIEDRGADALGVSLALLLDGQELVQLGSSWLVHWALLSEDQGGCPPAPVLVRP
jgi:hypothetical protein